MKRSALSAELLRTFFVSVAFILLSRELALEEIGVVSAITAALAIIGPVATLGLPFRVLKDSANGGGEINYRSALLTVCLLTGPVFVAICLVIVLPYARDTEIFALVLLVFAECWLLMSFYLLTSYGVGATKPRALVLASVLTSFPRFASSSVLFLVPAPSVELYAISLASLAVPATFAALMVMPHQGRLRLLPLRALFADRKAGGLSTTSSLLSRCSDDLDKLLLGSLRGSAEVAIYSIPYRLTFYAMIPGRAFLSSKMAGWYRSEGRGVKSQVFSVIIASSASGLILSFIVYQCWPLLTTYVIGEKFSGSQSLIIAFGVAVVVRGVHYSLGEILFARLAMIRRNAVQLIAVVSGIVAMVFLIPPHGVQGAAWATVLIEIVTLLGYLVALNEKK